jgi:Starch-binding associating with outer membrane
MPATFLAQKDVAFDETATEQKQLKQIMLQKYIASFFMDYQAWFEKRRTGFPVLPPKGSGISGENKFPSRAPYPTYLQSLNPEGLAGAVASIGGNKLDIKV